MPLPTFDNPFNLPLSGTVDANGDLTVSFGPAYNQTWSVEQVSLEMSTAPAGSTAAIRYMGSLVTGSPSARKGSAGGDPPIFLQGGETMTVEWSGCTPNDVGRVLVVYRKGVY